MKCRIFSSAPHLQAFWSFFSWLFPRQLRGSPFDIAGTKRSDYVIAPTSAPERLLAVLSAALGAQETVIKTRLLFRIGQTRIHLDSVVGLGSFIELEVVLGADQSPDEGRQIAGELMSALDIREGDLIKCAYADLLGRMKDEGTRANDE